jgi:hypothetical protein
MLTPMLPDTYAEHKIIYPALVQPFINGDRAIYQDGSFQTKYKWSDGINEIATSLQNIFPIKVILDGILHDDKYSVFDVVNFRAQFKTRFDAVVQVLRDSKDHHEVKTVPTRKMFAKSQADDQFDFWLNEGYHGMIYRLGNCPYTKPTTKNKQNRSRQLLLREKV